MPSPVVQYQKLVFASLRVIGDVGCGEGARECEGDSMRREVGRLGAYAAAHLPCMKMAALSYALAAASGHSKHPM